MRRALIIANPRAGRAGGRRLALARGRLESHGLDVSVEYTAATGDGERLARAATRDGVAMVIAHGGDGTAMDVAGGLVGSGLPLGLLPAGTGNVLAGTLGISRSPRVAADVIAAGATRSLDLGRLTTPTGTRYFTINCAAGFAAELMAETAAHHKRIFGVLAYVARAFLMARRLTRARMTIEVDGTCHQVNAATVLVANCGQIVPRLLPLAKHVDPQDGLLDVAVFDADWSLIAVRIVWRLLHRRPDAEARLTFHQGRSVRISAEPPLPVQADGDLCGTTPMQVELLPGALTVLVPSPRAVAGVPREP